MDTSKILTVACTVLLLVCLVLSTVSLTTLRDAIRENEAQKNTNVLTQGEHDCLGKSPTEAAKPEQSTSAQDTPTQATAPTETFCLKEANGRIGVFTSDGYLVRFLDVSVDALPPADREALRVGITVGSWRELMSVIQDYTA